MTLSRMAGAALLMLAAAPVRADEAPLDRYYAATSVEPHCNRAASGGEIVVCGRRAADRYRVPFVGYDKGDPRGEGVSAERNRLASEPPRRCGEESVLRNCGKVDVSVSTRFASGELKARPLAP